MNSQPLKTLAAAALLAASAQNVHAQASPAAQPAPAAASSSPAKKELVAKLLQLQQPGFETLGRSLLQRPIAQLSQGVGQALQQVPPEKREAAIKAIDADIKKFVDETGPLMRDRAIKLAPSTIGAMLEERFTEDELKQLVAWFESPVNKKYNQMGAEMQKALTEKLVAETRSTVEARLKTLEQNMVKQLGITPPPAPAASPAKK
ncbi:DUF2059 domain-containing protein [Paucibacter sp. XJ19-41]|uniref:DUF2059 domain-containing protein n=1 Tax=Paucibacter sp. XJ19-41 TaxID=2927824 RepID=UPI00234A2307|nr:DUF2059 domain-containing protein [Paucibacter sp. XJ19-41]MDC6169186.1 DUF2059 domain-containing protein [Paucibacter sp. XJ19-41]